GGAAGGCSAVFGARRLAGGGRRCRGSTCRQSLSGGGASVRQPWIRRCRAKAQSWLLEPRRTAATVFRRFSC
ncbi:Os07g0631501, partial [Oryza sativa Japonica Group]